jgi:hypothetical protein
MRSMTTFSLLSRMTGNQRCWVVAHVAGPTCKRIITVVVPSAATAVYSNEWRSYREIAPMRPWRTPRGNGRATVTAMNTAKCTARLMKGQGPGLRNFLQPFHGVHKGYLQEYVALYEALVNTKRVTPTLICRMCWPPPPVHGY